MQMCLCLGDRFATGRKLPDLHWLIFTFAENDRSIVTPSAPVRPPLFKMGKY